MTDGIELLREWVRVALQEADRGGIEAQQRIAARLKELRPEYDFVSNVKGQQTADVTASLDGKEVAHIESKSSVGLKGLTAVFDRTVSSTGDTVFDDLARALAAAVGAEPEEGQSAVSTFISAVGGTMGETRPIEPALEKNLADPSYRGFSHKLMSKSGKEHVFEIDPTDEGKSDAELKVFRAGRGGAIKAFNTVRREGETLITTSSPRPWSSSGKIPAQGGISADPAVKEAALAIMLEHFREDGDNYYMLVDGNDIYPYITGNDVLNLAELGAPRLSADAFSRAGLSTYGNAGAGKIRLALKAQFKPTTKL